MTRRRRKGGGWILKWMVRRLQRRRRRVAARQAAHTPPPARSQQSQESSPPWLVYRRLLGRGREGERATDGGLCRGCREAGSAQHSSLIPQCATPRLLTANRHTTGHSCPRRIAKQWQRTMRSVVSAERACWREAADGAESGPASAAAAAAGVEQRQSTVAAVCKRDVCRCVVRNDRFSLHAPSARSGGASVAVAAGRRRVSVRRATGRACGRSAAYDVRAMGGLRVRLLRQLGGQAGVPLAGQPGSAVLRCAVPRVLCAVCSVQPQQSQPASRDQRASLCMRDCAAGAASSLTACCAHQAARPGSTRAVLRVTGGAD